MSVTASASPLKAPGERTSATNLAKSSWLCSEWAEGGLRLKATGFKRRSSRKQYFDLGWNVAIRLCLIIFYRFRLHEVVERAKRATAHKVGKGSECRKEGTEER